LAIEASGIRYHEKGDRGKDAHPQKTEGRCIRAFSCTRVSVHATTPNAHTRRRNAREGMTLQATLSNPLALKVTTALATLVLIALLFFVRYLGKNLARTKTHGMYDDRLLSWHRWAVGCAASAGLVTVFLIERVVNLAPVSHRDSSLFRFHLAIDAALLIVGMAIVARFTGKKDPRLHRKLTYLFYALVAISSATGTWMLVSL
jgi:cytochrome bd-type quinol oxidase subunit 2